MATRVFEYGLLPPHTNAALVDQQMRLGHRYRNALIEIERDRRAEVMSAMSAHPDVSVLEAQIDDARGALDLARRSIALTRSAARVRSDTLEQRAHTRDLGQRLKELRAVAKEARARIATDQVTAAAIASATERAAERVRRARAECGVYWGTYLLHEAAMASSRDSGRPAEYRPYTGEGRVSVQIQGGIDLADLWGTDTQIQISVPPSPTVRRRQGRNSLLRLRVQSENRKPVWAEWPLIMHRQPPPGARIKVATVTKRRRGTSWDWRLHLTIDVSASPAPPCPEDGAVALNLGFARRPNAALRAGYLVGTDGLEREVLTEKSSAFRGGPPDGLDPGWVLRGLAKADAIRSQRDLDMDTMRAALCEWRGAQDPATLPDWFVERTTHIASWRSPGRFAGLARAWQRGWFEGGEAGYDLLEAWRARDLHLERYETGLRTNTLRDRREGYRVLAARLAARYRTIVIDDTDLRAFQRSPNPESEETEIAAAKYQQRVAAGSELRAAITNAFGPGRVKKMSAVNVTCLCHACGQLQVRDDTAREVTCAHCGLLYDQDANACRNLLREWSRAKPTAEAARAGNPAEPRPTRVERMRAGRVAKRNAESLESS